MAAAITLAKAAAIAAAMAAAITLAKAAAIVAAMAAAAVAAVVTLGDKSKIPKISLQNSDVNSYNNINIQQQQQQQ